MEDFEKRNMENWSLPDAESITSRIGEKIKDKYFPEMRKQLNLHTDKVHSVPRKINREHSKPKHVLLKLLNYRDKIIMMPKAFRKRKQVTYKQQQQQNQEGLRLV